MGILGKWLSKVFGPATGKVLESALWTGIDAALGVLALNVTDIVQPDWLNGLGVVAATALIKLLRKIVAGQMDAARARANA